MRGTHLRNSQRSAPSKLLQINRFHPQVPIRHRPVIPLQPDRAGRLLVLGYWPAGRTAEFDVFMDELAVVHELHNLRVGDLLAAGVKAWRAEGDVECLPLAGRLAGVDAWGVAFDVLLIDPAGVDAATFDARILILLSPKAVIHLHLIAAHQIHSGVGVLGNAEFY